MCADLPKFVRKPCGPPSLTTCSNGSGSAGAPADLHFLSQLHNGAAAISAPSSRYVFSASRKPSASLFVARDRVVNLAYLGFRLSSSRNRILHGFRIVVWASSMRRSANDFLVEMATLEQFLQRSKSLHLPSFWHRRFRTRAK